MSAIAELWVLDEEYGQGIHDHTDAENPFADWHHIFIPYCTGDLHSGDADHTYELDGQSFTVHHKGAVNTRAVLDWIYRNLPDPEKIEVKGVRLVDWVKNAVNDVKVETLDCDPDCGTP